MEFDELMKIIDDEIYNLDRFLSCNHDPKAMRAIVFRQMVKQAVVGMNKGHFESAETDDDD